MWIFGYGSLMWKVDFPSDKKLVGYVKGYARRFWQGSEDHRGVPGKPGRVVTLVSSEDSQACVWGVAYHITEKDISEVCLQLDFREKGGYKRAEVTFHPQQSNLEKFQLTIYVGDQGNPFYLGPCDPEKIAQQISSAEGPSGKNCDYLFLLAATMRKLAPDVKDEHLFQLEASVRKILAKNV